MFLIRVFFVSLFLFTLHTTARHTWHIKRQHWSTSDIFAPLIKISLVLIGYPDPATHPYKITAVHLKSLRVELRSSESNQPTTTTTTTTSRPMIHFPIVNAGVRKNQCQIKNIGAKVLAKCVFFTHRHDKLPGYSDFQKVVEQNAESVDVKLVFQALSAKSIMETVEVRITPTDSRGNEEMLDWDKEVDEEQGINKQHTDPTTVPVSPFEFAPGPDAVKTTPPATQQHYAGFDFFAPDKLQENPSVYFDSQDFLPKRDTPEDVEDDPFLPKESVYFDAQQGGFPQFQMPNNQQQPQFTQYGTAEPLQTPQQSTYFNAQQSIPTQPQSPFFDPFQTQTPSFVDSSQQKIPTQASQHFFFGSQQPNPSQSSFYPQQTTQNGAQPNYATQSFEAQQSNVYQQQQQQQFYYAQQTSYSQASCQSFQFSTHQFPQTAGDGFSQSNGQQSTFFGTHQQPQEPLTNVYQTSHHFSFSTLQPPHHHPQPVTNRNQPSTHTPTDTSLFYYRLYIQALSESARDFYELGHFTHALNRFNSLLSSTHRSTLSSTDRRTLLMNRARSYFHVGEFQKYLDDLNEYYNIDGGGEGGEVLWYMAKCKKGMVEKEQGCFGVMKGRFWESWRNVAWLYSRALKNGYVPSEKERSSAREIVTSVMTEEGRTHFSRLDVKPNVEEGELRKKYRAMAMKIHPDKNRDDKDATKNFQLLVNAFETVSDPEKRLQYEDELLTSYEQGY